MVTADTSTSDPTASSSADGTGSGRSYVSRLRSEQAAATRDRVVRAAAELFAERGYAGTTLPAIGRRAGVSTETVQNHGPKVELLRAAIDAVSFGAGPGAAVSETELGRLMMGATSATEAARRSAEVLATVNQSSHGVWMAFSEASRSDETLTAELRRLTEEIAGQTRDRAGAVAEPGVASDRSAADRARPASGCHRLGRALGPPGPSRRAQPGRLPGADRRDAAGPADGPVPADRVSGSRSARGHR